MAVMTSSLTRSAAGPTLGRSAARRCASARAPVSFVRASRAAPVTQAYLRSGSWSSSDEAAMKSMIDNMARAAGVSGTFYWPGGSYAYGSSRWKPCAPSQHRHQPSGEQSGEQQAGGARSLSLDVVSSDGFFLLYADVPGLSKADLSIKLSKERVLKIAGARPAPADWEGWAQKERRFGAFERQWQLPDDADSQGISAKVADGVLTVTVPKKQPEPEVDESEDIAIN